MAGWLAVSRRRFELGKTVCKGKRSDVAQADKTKLKIDIALRIDVASQIGEMNVSKQMCDMQMNDKFVCM